MRECNNSKIHISGNFLLSKSLIIMLDTLLLVPLGAGKVVKHN